MDYGAILKRAWHITWRYKALWILGMFAGLTGAGGGGGGNSGSNWNSGSRSGSGTPDFNDFGRNMLEYLPAIIAAAVILLVIGVVWWVLAVAARGGLIAGVNSIEEGRPQRLGELWSVGFSRFWRMVGLDILVALPLMVVTLLMMAAIVIPLIAASVAGQEPGAEIFAPVCGSLLVGVPVLLVGGFILGVMRIMGQRYIVLGGQGAVESAKNGWRFLRARVGSTLIMFLINWAVSLAASLVLVIPMVALGVGLGVPLFMSATAEKWGTFAGLLFILVVIASVFGLAFSAIWGTFTSAIWTLFFRQASGMVAPVQAVPAGGYQQQPVAPAAAWDPLVQPEPPSPPAPPAPQAWPEQPAPPPAPPVPPTDG